MMVASTPDGSRPRAKLHSSPPGRALRLPHFTVHLTFPLHQQYLTRSPSFVMRGARAHPHTHKYVRGRNADEYSTTPLSNPSRPSFTISATVANHCGRAAMAPGYQYCQLYKPWLAVAAVLADDDVFSDNC